MYDKRDSCMSLEEVGDIVSVKIGARNKVGIIVAERRDAYMSEPYVGVMVDGTVKYIKVSMIKRVYK